MEPVDLWAQAITWPPPVPAVTFHPKPHRRSVELEKIKCGHCQMNAERFRSGKPVDGWRATTDIVILNAVALITHCDGSTLSLCRQHEEQYQQRGSDQ